MRRRLSGMFQKLDIFGYPIGVNYKGSDIMQTRLGAFFTITVYGLMMIANVVQLGTAYKNGSKQQEQSNFQIFDRAEGGPYNFHENQFEVVILPSLLDSLPPRIGTFKARQLLPCSTEDIESGNCDFHLFKMTDIKIQNCTDEKKDELRQYFKNRLNERFLT